MKKIILTVMTLLLTMGFSLTAFAHPGHLHASVFNLTLHNVATISVYLALMVATVLIIKRLPKIFKQRIKK